MTLLIVRHLALSGIGVGTVFLVALLLRLLAQRDAVLRYRLMVAALLAAAALLPLQAITAELAPHASAASSAPVCAPPIATAASHAGGATAMGDAGVCAPGAMAVVPAAPVVVPASDAGVGAGDGADLPTPLLVTYLAGIAVMVVIFGLRAMAIRRLFRTARPVTDAHVLLIWNQLVTGMRRPPTLLESDGLRGPACCAMGRPRVILPTGSGTLDDNTLLAALRHELIHLQRCDGVVACIAVAITTVLWFQPLVWVFARMLAVDREHSCDALVVRVTRQPRSYALALLRFCNPPGSAVRAMSLIGFESAHSISRRITMLAHALQPAARPRHTITVGVGLACLVSVSVAHGLLTAAADPGPVLGTVPPANAPAQPAAPSDAGRQGSRMTAEVAAKASGRSDADVYRRLVKAGIITSNPSAIRSDFFVFADRPAAKAAGVRLPIATVNDQETILAAGDAKLEGDALLAEHVRLSLPDGSKLRAVFEGRTVNIEPETKEGTNILVTGGTVRIVDEHGITRIEAHADSQRGDATLSLTSVSTPGAISLQLSASAGAKPVAVGLSISTEVPQVKRESPHGAVNWNLVVPKSGRGSSELKMQWTYDVDKLAATDDC